MIEQIMNIIWYVSGSSNCQGIGDNMRAAIIGLCLVLFVTSSASAQLRKKTYFLIDASGSMEGKIDQAEQRVSDELKKLDPDAPVSRTYFGGKNGGVCWSPIIIAPETPASQSKREKIAFLNDSSQLGVALKEALEDAGPAPANIFLMSDEEQTENCGIDICAVANEYLPRRGVRVIPVAIDPAPKDKDRLGCIEGAQSSPTRNAVTTGGTSTSVTPAMTPSGAIARYDWNTEGWWERWLWLVVFLIAIGSAIGFGARWLVEALAYEKRGGQIDQRQRMILMGEGNEEENRAEIVTLSTFEFDKRTARLILVAFWVGASLAFLTLLTSGILLFCEGACFFVPMDDDSRFLGIKLDAARQLAWFVLSSGFSNAFAILATTPVIAAGAFYVRSLQAKRNFLHATNAAAEEEAKRRDAEIDTLFAYLVKVRESILQTVIKTAWAEPSRFGQMGGRRSRFNEEDRENLALVKTRLLQVAQGPLPMKAGESKKSLTDKITKLERYAPKKLWGLWETPWTLDELINDLNKSENNAFKKEATDWTQLAQAVRDFDTKQIKASLKKLAGSKKPD